MAFASIGDRSCYLLKSELVLIGSRFRSLSIFDEFLHCPKHALVPVGLKLECWFTVEIAGPQKLRM